MNIPDKSSNEWMWRNLLRLADRLSSSVKTDCDLPSRLPLSQLRVVGIIYDRHPEGVMLKDVADELKLTPGAVSQTVDVLVRENIVERSPSPSDRRAILLRPTPMGLKLKEEHTMRIDETMHAISEGIDPDELHIFATVLNRLLEKMNQLYCSADK